MPEGGPAHEYFMNYCFAARLGDARVSCPLRWAHLCHALLGAASAASKAARPCAGESAGDDGSASGDRLNALTLSRSGPKEATWRARL